ncbi:hypothetical protein [uncultured Campylobacter sp.]|nr:hypothetical protein [uncultured Campylobacter sp.]
MRDYDKEPIAAVKALCNTGAKTDKRSAKQALIKQILLSTIYLLAHRRI